MHSLRMIMGASVRPLTHVFPRLTPHDTALLEREHFPFPVHPRRVEINAALSSYRTLALAHAPAAPAPALPTALAGAAARETTMTLQAVSDALSSSIADVLGPALRELARMADNGEIEELQTFITQVSSKRILGHADFIVRAAAVAALSSLVKCDEVAARAGIVPIIPC